MATHGWPFEVHSKSWNFASQTNIRSLDEEDEEEKRVSIAQEIFGEEENKYYKIYDETIMHDLLIEDEEKYNKTLREELIVSLSTLHI